MATLVLFFIVLAVVSISNNNFILLAKVIAGIRKHGNITNRRSKGASNTSRRLIVQIYKKNPILDIFIWS